MEFPRVELRDATEADLPVFFEHQRDPEACYNAAFKARDREEFDAHWTRILSDATITKKAIVFQGEVVGNVMGFEQLGRPSVSYWIDREQWGRGLATAALTRFLEAMKTRPLYARAAKDNVASIRVLEKCGFQVCGEDAAFSEARGQDIPEFIFERTD